jgi:hypothetical protein
MWSEQRIVVTLSTFFGGEFPRFAFGTPASQTLMSRNGASDYRKPCFGPSAARPLPVADNSVVLIVRGWRVSLLPILLLRSSFLKNMRNEATEVRLDFVGQNASQQCKVVLNGPKERND